MLLPTALLLRTPWYLKHPIAIVIGLGGVAMLFLLLYVLVGRFIIRAFSSRHVRYIITDTRLVVVNGRSGRPKVEARLKALPSPVFTEAPNGSGSIAFGAFPALWDRRNRTGRGIPISAFSSESLTPVLWYIADVRRVHDLIATAQHRDQVPANLPPRSLATIDTLFKPTRAGTVIVFVFLIALSSLATALSMSSLPHVWWPQATATVAECMPIVYKGGSTNEVCTVTWSEARTEHKARIIFPTGKHPNGSTYSAVVHGDTAFEAHERIRAAVSATISVSVLSIVLVAFILWCRRWWRSRNKGAPALAGPDPRPPAGSPAYQPAASSHVKPGATRAAGSFVRTALLALLQAGVLLFLVLFVIPKVTGSSVMGLLSPPIGQMVIFSIIAVAAVLSVLRPRR